MPEAKKAILAKMAEGPLERIPQAKLNFHPRSRQRCAYAGKSKPEDDANA